MREEQAEQPQYHAQEIQGYRHALNLAAIKARLQAPPRLATMSLMGLMQEIRDYPVARNTVAIWWLGQNGFIFKTAEGTLLSTDLYLTNSCAETYADSGINLERQVPVLIPPEEIERRCIRLHPQPSGPHRSGHHRAPAK